MSTTDEVDDTFTVPAANVESDLGDASDVPEKVKRFTAPVSITIRSYRKYKHDPDGMSIKAILDGLVHAGILVDDSTKQVKQVTFKSYKADKEWTEIEIDDE